jgi:hypothetical protein
MSDEKITGPVKRKFESNPLDKPGMGSLRITGSTDPGHAQRLLDVLRGDPRKDGSR